MSEKIKVLLSEEEVDSRIKQIAAKVSKDYAGKEIVLVGILKGAMPFLCDLMREIDLPVILDTKGPEIRVTAVADEYGGAIGFQTGERVKVRGTADGEPSTRDTIYFNVATVVRDIAVGARLLIADGELELRVTDKTDEELMCEFVRGGTLRSRKSVNVPG